MIAGRSGSGCVPAIASFRSRPPLRVEIKVSVDLDQWEESGNGAFHTTEVDAPSTSSVFRLIGLGILLGLLCWIAVDRSLTWLHVSGWLSGGVALALMSRLPVFTRSVLKTVLVTPDGFTVSWHGRTETSAWRDLEAARFQDYPVVNLGTQVRCFGYRTRGKNVEVCIDGFDDATMASFRGLVASCLEAHGIPEHTPTMPSFQHALSQAGAWLYVSSAFGMMIAHGFSYHTLGTIFGTAIMATGVWISVMTRKGRASRVVLFGSLILVIGSVAIVLASGLSLRDTFVDWEQRERQLGRPPWNAQDEGGGATPPGVSSPGGSASPEDAG